MTYNANDVIYKAVAYKHQMAQSKRKKSIGVPDIEKIVAKIARIPPKSVSSSDKEQLRKLDENLKMTVFGQDEAIDTLTTAIKLSRAGLSSEGKPKIGRASCR